MQKDIVFFNCNILYLRGNNLLIICNYYNIYVIFSNIVQANVR